MKIVQRYQLEEIIGSGTYGKVYRSVALDTKETFAIKSIPMEKFRKVSKLHEFTKNEIFVLRKVSHPNIIKFVDQQQTENNVYLVYEYCDGGTLESLIYKKGFVPEAEALKYFA